MTATPNDRNNAASTEGKASGAELVPLPRYVSRQADGLYVSLQAFDSASHFCSFLDRIFGSGMRFSQVNYGNLCNLLYFWATPDIFKLARDMEAAGKPAKLFLAADIVPFPPPRQKFYHAPALIDGGEAAQYRFEPIMAEPEKSDSDGEPPQEELVKLDPDEFIAAMWTKNIRFGIDIDVVQEAIDRNLNKVAVVAYATVATNGEDATVAEMINSLHRSNAPKLLPDGRVDLRQFQNRFPQMDKNTKLIRKVPRVVGKSGWTLTGKEVTPPLPQDFEIETLSGLGTRVERLPIGEFIVADTAGFLQIDAATHQFSITQKIVNRDGVNLHSTGNLDIRAEE
ncbi:MAG TPA: flagellar assembly protein A, partial [Burkholderiaceae bacterium]|nr:flagellar assembly protein A [Burkholderiaceae bacterium]